MTVTIKYHEEFKNETISSYTYWWANDFGDIALESSERGYGIYSAGPNPPTVGVKFAIQSSSPQSKAAIVIESKGVHAAAVKEAHGVKLSEVSPIIPGENESLQFGANLIPIPDINLEDPQFHHLQLQQVQLKFSGLDISDDIDISILETLYAMYRDNSYPSDMDLGVYGLLRGNNASILKILESQGVDINTPLKDLALASQFDVIVDMPVIDTVADSSELLLAA
ncbi:heme acquisition protein HasA [Yersinia sp. 2542 StPb PI]|uniref:heme acquisition protein HasA n=1 Tax=unclassified Yersinia (in: enterobacteria) TaxID=2653513 RepID=UPI003B27E0CD